MNNTQTNGNGENDIFQCDIIACPPGTFSFSGIAEYDQDLCRKCFPCSSNFFLAAKTCDEKEAFSSQVVQWMDSSEEDSHQIFSSLFILILAIFIPYKLYDIHRAKQNSNNLTERQQNDPFHFDEDEDLFPYPFTHDNNKQSGNSSRSIPGDIEITNKSLALFRPSFI